MEVFPYAVFYMFFEQYLSIWRTALINLAIAIGQCCLSALNLRHLSAVVWYNFDYVDIMKSFFLLIYAGYHFYLEALGSFKMTKTIERH